LKNHILGCFLVSLVASAALAGPTAAIRHGGESTYYVVAVVDRAPAALPHLAASLEKTYGARLVTVFDGVVGGFLMDIPNSQVDRMASDPRVRWVEQDHPVQLSASKPASSTQHSLKISGISTDWMRASSPTWMANTGTATQVSSSLCM
jgi:hypothetical protein